MNDSAPGPIPIRILSNMRRLESFQTQNFSVVHRFVDQTNSIWNGIIVFLKSFYADVVLLDGQERSLLAFCLFRWLFPFRRCRLVSLDTQLRRPRNRRELVAARFKRWLLRRVDHFALNFKDLEGYEKFYGISPARNFYVPFKVNLSAIPLRNEVTVEGEYVVTIGRSHRDLQTFVAAMRQVDYPGVLLYDDRASVGERESELELSKLPCNLRHELYSEGGDKRYIELTRRAKLVVLPIVTNCISSAGISAYLLAMAFCRCVIITDSPATRGLLTDQAIIVPPADATALANAIRHAWEDDTLRKRVAEAGRRYAARLGEETRLLHDVVNLCGDLVLDERK
jgi:glycosyltransferase involved in cell wall biosynthesis